MIWLLQVLKLKKCVVLIKFYKMDLEEICFFLRPPSRVLFFL